MNFYDTQETRDPALREQELFGRLPGLIHFAQRNTTAYARTLSGIDPAAITDRAALARIPVTRKSELLEKQKLDRPFGGFAPDWRGAAGRVYASPGPIYEPEGRAADYWRTARALYAAGFRSGDLVHNAFSYHMTPGAWIMEAGAQALGCSVFPAGVGQTEQQVQAMADLQPDGYVGTPSFLRILVDKAEESGVALPRLKKALVSGEAFPPSVRDSLAAKGIQAYQAYATADLGAIAYESPAREGLIVDEGVIVEIVRPGTGEPVADGEVGELVVTVFNHDYPLIRFGTGDLSAVLPGASPCGRTNMRIKGWMGRADQTTKVKGMFVHPSQVADVVRRHASVQRARLVVENPDHQDRMTLHCEVAEGEPALAEAIVGSIREVTKLRGEVVFCPPGSLANDGKVIDDLRRYE